MDIEKLMLPIAEFTEYGEVCFAHLSENGERKETLREHTELCQKYWKEIVKRKKIDEIFQEFENVYLEELSKESRRSTDGWCNGRTIYPKCEGIL